MTRLVFILSLSLSMIGLSGSSFAEKPESKTAKEKAAKKACAMGDFQKGADILTDLLVETDNPTYIYNQARCYQQNNRWEQAISRFQEYLRKTKGISASERSETERQIADCEQSMGKPPQEATSPAAATSSVPVIQPSPLLPAREPATLELSNPTAPLPPDGSKGKGLRIAGITSVAIGVAAIGTGVFFALKSQGLSTKDYSQSREKERASLRTSGLVSYGVGAAALVTGAVLYLVGWPIEPSSSVALSPIATPDGASLLLKGRF